MPASALRAVAPVDAALVRSTDSVPSTTQKPCCTPVRSATAMAAARATAPRTLLRNHADRTLTCRSVTVAAAVSAAVLGSVAGASPVRPYHRRRRSPITSGSARRIAISASSAAWCVASARVRAWKDRWTASR